MDGGAWWTAVHGVAKSQIQLSNEVHTHILKCYVHVFLSCCLLQSLLRVCICFIFLTLLSLECYPTTPSVILTGLSNQEHSFH